MKKDTIYINNRKARFNYFIAETYTAGICLTGSEVKSLRLGKANISEAFIYINDDEVFLKNMSITAMNNIMFSHEEVHDRKLLLTKKEIKKIAKAIDIKGTTCVPLKVIVPTSGFIKIEIAVCTGKHNYDKRNTIKERDLSRETKNILK